MGKFARFIVTFVVLLIVGILTLSMLNGVDDSGGGIGGILDGGGSSGSTDSGGGTPTTPGGSSGGVTGCKHTGEIRRDITLLAADDTRYHDMHHESNYCYSCGKVFLDIDVSHNSFENGICSCGYVCDHSATIQNGVCVKCQTPVTTNFTINGSAYSVDNGWTWQDMANTYSTIRIDADGAVTISSNRLIDSEGYLVISSYQIVNGEAYVNCTHQKKINETYTYETVTQHRYSAECQICKQNQQYLVSHVFGGGTSCTQCGHACEHLYVGGICSYCRHECTHDYADGVCKLCGDGCEHEYQNGVCANCGASCAHSDEAYINMSCDKCGITMIKFTVDGDAYVIASGSTWRDVLVRYSAAGKLTTDADNNVYYEGTILVDANGDKISAADTVAADAMYQICVHKGADITYYDDGSGRHFKTIVCELCQLNSSLTEEHTYNGGVCTLCSAVCQHNGAVTGGFCGDCGKAVIRFTVGTDYTYTVSTGLTWAQLINTHDDFTTGTVDGVVYWKGYALTDKDGVTVKTSAVISAGAYTTCTHLQGNYTPSYQDANEAQHITIMTCNDCGAVASRLLYDHTFNGNTCSKCLHVCEEHIYTDEYICQYCGQACPHEEWILGECIDCRKPCEHDGDIVNISYGEYNEAQHAMYGECKICGQNVTRHVDHYFNEDGVCAPCGHTCTHDYNDDHECIYCGQVCPHNSFIDNECEYCGMTCYHDELMDVSYSEYNESQHAATGTCVDCGHGGRIKYLDHTFEDGVCTLCGYECTHSHHTNWSCTYCGRECPHEAYEEGKCVACGFECGHADYVIAGYAEYRNDVHHINVNCQICNHVWQVLELHSFEDSTCTKCGHVCEDHLYYGDNECDYCGYVCEHDSYTNGKCDECGTVCAHEDLMNITYSEYNDALHKMVGTCKECNTANVIKYTTHHYEEGICAPCMHECEHISEAYGDTCEYCGTEFIQFTIDGDLYVVPDGATWTTVMSMYKALNLTVDGDEVMIGAEHYIETAEGDRVKITYEVLPGGTYFAYPHTYDDNGVCTNCGHECGHWFCGTGNCSTCDIPCPHKIVTDGVCVYCGENVG